MASLQQLLSDEGFERGRFTKTLKPPLKLSLRNPPDDSIALPIYICHDRKRFDKSKRKSSNRTGSSLHSSRKDKINSKSVVNCEEEDGRRREEPYLDEIAIRAVVSILSGYIGRYLKDETFRNSIREKCNSCLFTKLQENSDNGVFSNFESAIEIIEKIIAEKQGNEKEIKIQTLNNSIHLLSIVSSYNSKNTKNGFTRGTPNSYLAACAQLYLSIACKIEKNDRISARHLLQVFCDSPFLGRTHLLPDLWEHLFLPHLLHLKIWYKKELEFVWESDYFESEKKIKALEKVYNEEMDKGTTQFALYYIQWLKDGAQAPPVPSMPLPSRPNYGFSKRSSSDSLGSRSSINKNLYQSVFGPNYERRSMELDHKNGGLMINTWGLEEQEKVCIHEDNMNQERASRRSSSLQIYRTPKIETFPEAKKPENFRFLICKSEPTESLVNKNRYKSKSGSIKTEEKTHLPSSDSLSRAITTIISSDSLENCEISIRIITKSWLDSQGKNPSIESALSKPLVIESILEVLFASNDDEILELAISILSELASRNDSNKQIILNSDPQLEIFIKLLRSSSLFLKSSVLLYLIKPKAKQMISMDWVPLILRVLEFGDQIQTLFMVKQSPRVAALYFLDQLLTGFDEDRNLENTRQVISLGGLSLLVKRIEKGDIRDRNNVASIICCCIRADGSCRIYLANNLSNTSVLELFIVGNQRKTNGCALQLLVELICINRRTRITKFLNDILRGGCINAMHVFLVYLHRSSPEERPLVASILFQLDLMRIEERDDVSKCSIYREEVIDAIIESLDTKKYSEEAQEQSARALGILAGRFSYTGEDLTEKWLLKKAGFDDHDRSVDLFQGKDIIVDEFTQSSQEEEAITKWQRKLAIVLLINGNTRLLAVFSDALTTGVPKLARACLVTVSWISYYLPSIGDERIRSNACSILVGPLLECLKYDRDIEERVLGSFSLLNLVKNSDCISTLLVAMDKKLLGLLQSLSLITWTANELISMISIDPRRIT